MLAVLMFVTAWFLPVERDGAQLADGVLPGFQAFLVAIGPVTMHRFSELDLITLRELLCALSALSNLLVVYALGLLLWVPSPSWPVLRRLSTLLLFAFIINAQWIWPRGGEFLNLRIGYWLWCASYGLLAIAVRRLGRTARASLAPATAPAPAHATISTAAHAT
jgi:hypothetical protein